MERSCLRKKGLFGISCPWREDHFRSTLLAGLMAFVWPKWVGGSLVEFLPGGTRVWSDGLWKLLMCITLLAQVRWEVPLRFISY
jgi:hypothetical protein